MTQITLRTGVDVNVIQWMGGDHMIAGAARVSVNASSALELSKGERSEEVGGLINFLMKHKHGTPFEAAAITFVINAPIFVWREFHRHRIGVSFNENSARYSTLQPVFFLPDRDRPMMKVDDWKPGRPKFLLCDDDEKFDLLCKRLTASYQLAYDSYEANLAAGFDPGLARDCLPVGIYSSCWFTCNPRSLMHFLGLRTHEPTAKFVSYPLYEIEQVARKIEAKFAEWCPLTHKAFVANGRVAP